MWEPESETENEKTSPYFRRYTNRKALNERIQEKVIFSKSSGIYSLRTKENL